MPHSGWITVVSSVYEMSLIGYYFFSLLHRRFGKPLSYALYFIYAVLAVVKHIVLFEHMGMRVTLQFVLTGIMLMILFTDSFWKKLGTFFLYTCGAILGESAVMFAGVLCFGKNFFLNQETNLAFLTVDYAMVTIMAITLVQVLRRKNDSFRDKSQRFILVYCILQFTNALLVYVVLWDYRIQAAPLMILYLIMLAVSVFFGIYLLKMVRAASAEQARADQMALQAKLANEHFGRLQVQYEQYRKLRHDYYNHINVIRSISDPEKREAYIDDLTKKIEDRNGIAFCSDAVLDALLFNEKVQADAKGVKLTYKIGDISEMTIPDLDICTVLSNLLDNAITAASECEKDRFAELTMTIIAGQLAIRVSNSANPPKENLETTKNDRASHGLGLSIVRNVANKYGGAAVHSYENGIFRYTFTVKA